MISKLSDSITVALCKSGVIEEADRELYVYGFFVLLSQGFFLLITVLFGLVLETVWESIAFYIMFSALRSYAGGFHASKESVCTCCTTVALFFSVLGLNHLGREESVAIPICMLVFSSAVVYLLSPLESASKPLSIEECRVFRQKTMLISLAIIVVALSGWLVHIPGLPNASAISMFLESLLLILGRIQCSVELFTN